MLFRSQRLILQGIPLGSRIRFRAGPGLVSLRATVVGRDGRTTFVDLGSLDASRPRDVSVVLPKRLRGGTLVGLELVPPRLQERGADAGHALAGTLRLEGIPMSKWLGAGGVQAQPVGQDGVVLRYRITPESDAVTRARQLTDAMPPSVLATPRLAALAGGLGGTLPLAIGGGTVPVRVAAVVDRFPGTKGEVVIGDVGALGIAVNAQVPGAGRTNEVWLSVPPPNAAQAAATLGRAPFSGVEVVSRQSLEAEARNDPLGHGTLLALATAALVALVLAALGLALTVLSDLRDDRGDLFDLESQGVGPAQLRRVVRVRALLVGIAGIVAGSVAGAVLALLVTRVVAVTARAAAPDPPLQIAFDLRVIVLAAFAYLVVATLLVVLATRRSFSSGRGPVRAQETGT